LLIIEGIIPRRLTTVQVIMIHIESGSQGTGKAGGLPRVGKGSGFGVTGDIGHKRKGLKNKLQSLSFSDTVLSCLVYSTSLLQAGVNAEHSSTV